jgi:polysaccharide export outer membrane protein
MKKWLLGVFALVVVCVWPPVLDAFQAGQATQAAQPPATPSLSREFQPRPYTVGPGDKIKLDFYNLSDSDLEMKKEYLVEAAGTIQLKYVGSINVKGFTTTQIEDAVKKALVERQLYPAGVVSVVAEVSDERLQSVTVNGQVSQPGEKLLKGTQMTLGRAITAAGGVTQNAGQEIEIRRNVDGSAQVIKVTQDMMMNGDDPQLIAEDQIFVSQGQVFFVSGQVGTPGTKVWKPGMTVQQAVAMSGGMTAKGKFGYIDRPRKDAQGKIIGYDKKKNLKKETEIYPDDTLVIAAKWIG